MTSALYESYRTLVRGTTINGVTLLSTDYLNHFNEVVMLLEIVPDMPDMLDDVRAWQPKTYQEHFADSQFKLRDLAIEAYEASPPEFRQSFDAVTERLNGMIAQALVTTGETVAAGDPDRLRITIADITAALRTEIDRAGAIVNGSAERIDQDGVDAMFGDAAADSVAVTDGADAVPGGTETTPIAGEAARGREWLAHGLLEIEIPFEVAIAFSRGMAAVLNSNISCAPRNNIEAVN